MSAPRDPKLSEKITVGKTKLYRTRGNSFWFHDVNGNEKTFSDVECANALFNAAKDGSGTVHPNIIEQGTLHNPNAVKPNKKAAPSTGLNGYFGGHKPR